MSHDDTIYDAHWVPMAGPVVERVAQYTSPIPPATEKPSFDYRAIVDARGDLQRRGEELRAAALGFPANRAMRLGMAAQACDAAAQALFEALNMTAHYGVDAEALRVVHMRRFLTPEEQAADEAEDPLER